MKLCNPRNNLHPVCTSVCEEILVAFLCAHSQDAQFEENHARRRVVWFIDRNALDADAPAVDSASLREGWRRSGRSSLGLHLMWLRTTGEQLHAAGIGD